MPLEFRCDCPFTSALDLVGDKWILVIVKQMLVEGKTTFKDFTDGEEGIATNILSVKLKFLEEVGIVVKKKLPTNKKTNLYVLTEKGLALAPILTELATWSDRHLRDIHPTLNNGEGMTFLRNDKAGFTKALVDSYDDFRTEIS